MANRGQGTLLKVGDGAASGEAFTTLGDVLDINGPGWSMDVIDTTDQDSSSSYREKIGGLLDAGQVTCTIHWDYTETTHAGLITDFEARTLRNFQLVSTDSSTTTWTFAALVANIAPGRPLEGKVTADITLDISGQPSSA